MYKFPPKRRASLPGEIIEYVVAGSGSPAVVLVNGLGGPIEGWHKVFGPIAEFSKVFAYNRLGVGGSSKPTAPQIGSRLVASLREALVAADMPPPYVLVGHSLGGLIVNMYARLHPSEVAAVVMLDATSPKDVLVLAKHETILQRFARRAMDLFVTPDPNSESEHVGSTILELENAAAFPAIPLTVLTGGKPAMAWATAPEALAARAAHQQELVSISPLGKQVIAASSGHFPQFTQPDLVISTIREAAGNSFRQKPLRGSA